MKININRLFVFALLFSKVSFSQQLIINEVSQGPTGAQEYVELLVVGTPTCNSIPCMDLRNYIIDDNNGNHATGGSTGIAPGCIRFKNIPFWSCIPIGTIILIFNDADINGLVPAQDLSMIDGNCTLVIPISDCTLLERHTTLPSSTILTYANVGFTNCGSWGNIAMANGDDSFQTINPFGGLIHSVSWGNNILSPIIYFAGSASGKVAIMNNAVDNNPANQANWVFANVVGNETPGSPNNAANGTWISSMNNSCLPVSPFSATTSFSNSGCVCNGSATITASGAIAPYTYTWLPSGGNSNTASGLCSGTYTVNSTSSNGCTQSNTVNVGRVSSLTLTINNTSIMCNGLNNGSATIAAIGGTLPYSYTWVPNGGNASSANGLAPGIYTVTVNDANNCSQTATTSITQPLTALTAVISSTNILCFGSANGAAAVIPNGGNPGYTYTWSPSGGNSYSANGLSAGIYTVTVTDVNLCAISKTVQVTQPTSITTTTSFTNAACLNNGTASVSTSGGTPSYTYTWSPSGGNAASASVPAGLYTVTVQDSKLCTHIATINVGVTAIPPTPTISSNSPICIGQNLNLNGGGGVSYQWNGPNSYTSSVQNPTITASTLTNSGIYTLTVLGANTCTNSIQLNVVVNPTPTANIGSNSAVCAGASINLTASGGASYSWSGPNSFTSATQNPNITNASNAMGGVYTATVTDGNGCKNTGTVSVSIVTATTTASNTGPYCSGATIQLNTPAAVTYTWTGPNSFVSNAQNPTIANSTAVMSGIYNLVMSAGTCSASASTSVTIYASPTPIASNTGPYCSGATIQLNCNAASSYTWTGPNAFSSNNQNASIANSSLTTGGTYTVSVTNANGCVNSSTTSVIVNSKPIAVANGTTVCFGSSANISATGGVTYSWIGPNSFTSNIANVTIPVVDNNTSGMYVVTVSSVNSCTNSSSVYLDVYPLPVPSITSTTKACLNTPVNFDGSVNVTSNHTSTGYTFQWTGPNNFLSANATTSFTPTSLSQSGIYTLSIVDDKGCVGATTTLVSIYPLPNASILIDQNKKCVPYCATFSIQTTSGTEPLTTSNWTFNGQTYNGATYNFCATTAADYLIKANFTDANGCSNSTSNTLNVYPRPNANFEYTPVSSIVIMDEVKFTDQSNGTDITNWDWNFINNKGYNTDLQNPNYNFENAGTFPIALVVTNKWGCADTVIKTITVGENNSFYIPSAFTPNDDGLNDTFFPKGLNVTKYDLMIFDRWGQKIFHTNDFSQGWDGTFNGEVCKDDIYAWKISISHKDAKTKVYTGMLTLYK